MFTGLIEDIGTIISIETIAEGKSFIIKAPKIIHEIKIDDSIATNGVCLTATKIFADSFACQAVHVTLEKTSLGLLKVNDPVNLELAMKLSDRLGGHMVQGHVGGMGKITHIQKLGSNWEISIEFSKELRKYMILEGSITLDGISLTIAELNNTSLKVTIIPHTLQNTNLSHKNVGDFLNIEVDILAKYLENFLPKSFNAQV
jgi:riboflavin synthase